MGAERHKVFLSFHHARDQAYREELLRLNSLHDLFIDASVDTGDIDENLNDQAIRELIRDGYLGNSSVTIVLVGVETKGRKHVDWEIYSSMYNGSRNKQSGVLVIMLPSTGCAFFTAAHGDEEKAKLYPGVTGWQSVSERAEYERRYPHAPARIIDNLLAPKAWVSVAQWDRVAGDPELLRFLIERTSADRLKCDYDLSRPMRRSNS